MRKIFTTILAALTMGCYMGGNAQSAEHFQCGTHIMMQKLMADHPELAAQIHQHEEEMKAKAKLMGGVQLKNQTVYTIPVVFHIVHDYGQENISDAQIFDAMRILNEDFNKLNADTNIVINEFKSIVADVGIQFKLANIDPDGNCTNGIDRIASFKTYNGGDNSKLNPWPRHKYLNIWVVNSIGSAGVAGYAYKPSGAQFGMMFLVDGIIILHDYIGSVGTGTPGRSRALTHEVGHYLGLDHPWGPTNEPGVACGDDGIDDTPITEGWTSCNLSGSVCNPPIIENVQNFMEYSYCSRMYTEDQKSLMRLTMNNAVADRNNLSTSANINATGVSGAASLCAPIADFYSNRKFTCLGDQVNFFDNSSNGTVSSWQWTFDDATPSTSNVKNPSGILFNNPGWKRVELIVSNAAGTDTKTSYDYIYVGRGIAEATAPYSEPFNDSTSFIKWSSYNPGNDSRKFTYTSSAGKTANGCIKLNTFGSDNGDMDEIVSPSVNLDYMNTASLKFWYSVGTTSATVSNINDNLKVQVSTNCGETWTTRLTLSGTGLTKAGLYLSPYTPSGASFWTQASMTIPQASLLADTRFKFQFVASETSNNFYLDDIEISGVTGIEENTSNTNSINIMPNPADDQTTIAIRVTEAGQARMTLLDLAGREVMELMNGNISAGNHKLLLNTDLLSNGMYLVSLNINGKVQQQKLVVK
jgi:PKD repeat protein